MAWEGWNIISAHNYINIQGVPLTKEQSASFKGHGFTPMCWREQNLLAMIIMISFKPPHPPKLRYITTHLSNSRSSHLGSWGTEEKGKRWNQQRKFVHELFVSGNILCEKLCCWRTHDMSTSRTFSTVFQWHDITLFGWAPYFGWLCPCFLAGNLHGWVGREC